MVTAVVRTCVDSVDTVVTPLKQIVRFNYSAENSLSQLYSKKCSPSLAKGDDETNRLKAHLLG